MNQDLLEKRLLEEGSSFSFFQAVRLLRRLSAARGLDPNRAVRVRPALTMNRTAAPIARIRRLEDDQGAGDDAPMAGYEVETHFLGLYGGSSPLPNFYTEDLIFAEQEDRNGARLFLDLFHQRLYDLYLRSLEKYHPLQELTESENSRFLELAWSLVGLLAPQIRNQMPASRLVLRYLPLFARPQRSAAGLQTLLEDFTGCPVHVSQCVERQMRIPGRHRFRLGESGHCLGANCLVGAWIVEYAGRIRIEVGPMSHTAFDQLMNEAGHWTLLIALLRYYLKTPVESELVLHLAASEAKPLELGNPQSGMVGRNTWLHGGAGRSQESEHTLTARVAVT